MMEGYIHSYESFGTVDGPGIRFVVFMQGCPMRCKYCHNPDTWEIGNGNRTKPEKIISDFLKNREFYKNGGITVTGGEPLLQAEFVSELFKLAKAENIHTCLDTSGIIFDENNPEIIKKIDSVLENTDLVMLDIKHIDEDKHKELTGFSNKNILFFAKHLEKRKITTWIRTVIVPGITDDEENLVRLGEFIGGLQNVKALDVLPYHTMGRVKYKELGLEYPLSGVPDAEKSLAYSAKNCILSGVKKVRTVR